MENEGLINDYIVVLAKEDGVNIMGLTRGPSTKFHHNEKLDCGEAYIAQFTENTSAIKVRGKGILYTKFGPIEIG